MRPDLIIDPVTFSSCSAVKAVLSIVFKEGRIYAPDVPEKDPAVQDVQADAPAFRHKETASARRAVSQPPRALPLARFAEI